MNYDRRLVTITNGKGEPHINGHVNAMPTYTFSAKVFDEPSVHGIDSGRISKLSLYRDGKQVANYDRGIDQPAAGEDRQAFDMIVRAFPVRTRQPWEMARERER